MSPTKYHPSSGYLPRCLNRHSWHTLTVPRPIPSLSPNYHLPFSAALLYPRWKMATYTNLLQPKNVRLIAKSARNTFSFMVPTHWETRVGRPTAGTAKWQVMCKGAANHAGLQAFRGTGADQDIINIALVQGAQLVAHPDKAFETQEHTNKLIKSQPGYNKATHSAEDPRYHTPKPRIGTHPERSRWTTDWIYARARKSTRMARSDLQENQGLTGSVDRR